jgi:hypothetical protein
MELIAAILLAGPLGYFGGTRRRGLVLYLLVWAVIFPIQTIDVYSTSSHGDILYWVVNAIILTAGIGLNPAGARLRERRTRTARAATSA